MSQSKALAIQGDRETLPALYHDRTELVQPLTDDVVIGIAEGVKAGLRPEKACAILRIGEAAFKEWYESGEALYGQFNHPSIPNLLPRQVDESDEDYQERYDLWMADCDLRVKLYLECNAEIAELSKEMMIIWREHANSDAFDRWKSAKEFKREIQGVVGPVTGNVIDDGRSLNGLPPNQSKHAQQVGTVINNFFAAAKENEDNSNKDVVIEGEIIEETET